MRCQNCDSSINLREYSPGHVGMDVYRCDQCARSIAKHKSNVPPNFHAGMSIENCMSACECGGHFLKTARQRCPTCLEIIDLGTIMRPDSEVTKRDSGEYYVEGYACPVIWKDNPR
jgi:hypothetical protein